MKKSELCFLLFQSNVYFMFHDNPTKPVINGVWALGENSADAKVAYSWDLLHNTFMAYPFVLWSWYRKVQVYLGHTFMHVGMRWGDSFTSWGKHNEAIWGCWFIRYSCIGDLSSQGFLSIFLGLLRPGIGLQ